METCRPHAARPHACVLEQRRGQLRDSSLSSRAQGTRPVELMTDFMMAFKLPKHYGAISATWLSKRRFGKKCESLSSFSSILLTILPILVCFLTNIVDEDHPLYANLLCLTMLRNIMGIIMMGPTDAMPYVEKIRRTASSPRGTFRRIVPHG